MVADEVKSLAGQAASPAQRVAVSIAHIQQATAATLHGQENQLAAGLSTHHTCRLGRWHDHVGDETLRCLPAFAALAEPHRQVHALGRQFLASAPTPGVTGGVRPPLPHP